MTADTVDAQGDFALNLDWTSYGDSKEAVRQLRHLVKKYVPKKGR